MSRPRTEIPATAFLAVALFAGAVRVLASPVLDQSNLVTNGGCGAIPGASASVGQSYTAGVSGTLSAIAVEVFPNSPASGCVIEPVPSQVYPLHVSIVSFDESGNPGAILGTAVLNVDQLGLSDRIVFPQVIPQTAGFRYGIMIAAPTAPDDITPAFWSVGEDTYSRGGDFIQYSSVPGDWSGVDEMDYAFETYVSATAVAEPSSLALMLLGLSSLLSRAKRNR